MLLLLHRTVVVKKKLSSKKGSLSTFRPSPVVLSSGWWPNEQGSSRERLVSAWQTGRRSSDFQKELLLLGVN